MGLNIFLQRVSLIKMNDQFKDKFYGMLLTSTIKKVRGRTEDILIIDLAELKDSINLSLTFITSQQISKFNIFWNQNFIMYLFV